MGLSSALLWWEEWQLRVLVISSLFIQYVLYFSFWMRRAAILRRLRVLVWIAYIASDAVAIYALATLFNRRKQTWDGERSALEVLWAPVLLIHLGGQPFISAYSLEDNELWKRHTITLVSQVTVALYVFCKWRSSEKILLMAAILLFVIGILKFAQKPWALRSASFNSVQTSYVIRSLHEEAEIEESIFSLEDYVQSAKKCVLDMTVNRRGCFFDFLSLPLSHMFVDLSRPYSFRIKHVRSFLNLEDYQAYNILQKCLGVAFFSLYTRIESIDTNLGVGLAFLIPFLALVSMVTFATSHKDGQDEKDIRVTYILLGCTTMLEILFSCWILRILISSKPNSPSSNNRSPRQNSGWSNDLVSQYNLFSFCVRKRKPTFLMKLATFNFLKELTNQHCYIQSVPIAFKITGVVRQHVEHGWRNYICDAASYRRFHELRGQWAIRRHHQLGWSLKKPFDESVLIWHMATNVCFYHPNTSPQGRQGEATKYSSEISNYMMYLLLIHPEMLMPGTRSYLFTIASDLIIEDSKMSLGMTEEIIAQVILDMPTADDRVPNARKLAGALMELGNEEERWTVIQGVWVEMLCYSANRCRGYLHAKCLGDGGEFLSTIWLLLSVMGMETLADRYQRSEPPQEEATEEAASTSRSLTRADGSEDNFSAV